jgi:hypothetical protein
MITISINDAELQKCLNQIEKYNKDTQEKVRQQVARSAVNIQRYAAEFSPKKRGGAGLAGSIRVLTHRAGFGATVYTDKKYASVQEFGLKNRKPIYPRYKNALAFGVRLMSGGKLLMTRGGAQMMKVVVKVVRKPGDIPPHPFIRPAVEKEKPTYIKNLIAILNMKK